MRIEVSELLAALPPVGIERATRLGLVITPQLETDDWRQLVSRVANVARTATSARHTLTAWLGDALVYGGAGGRGLITECAEVAGFDPGTLRNAKMVCTRIPLSCRHDALTWTHHCEVGLAFSDPVEIEGWLVLAESERLSTAALRRRVRAHLAHTREGLRGAPQKSSIAAFRLMRELRAVGRSLVRERDLWRRWPPETAQAALLELHSITEFIDRLRMHALGQSTMRACDPTLN